MEHILNVFFGVNPFFLSIVETWKWHNFKIELTNEQFWQWFWWIPILPSKTHLWALQFWEEWEGWLQPYSSYQLQGGYRSLHGNLQGNESWWHLLSGCDQNGYHFILQPWTWNLKALQIMRFRICVALFWKIFDVGTLWWFYVLIFLIKILVLLPKFYSSSQYLFTLIVF